jgi:hypothetical protein
MSEQKRVEARRIITQLVMSAKQGVGPIEGKQTTETRIKYSPSGVTKSEDGRITGCQWSAEYFQKPSWIQLSMWLTRQFVNTSEFQEAVASLSKMYGMKLEQLLQPLTSFLTDAIIERSRNGNMEILLNDLEEKPCDWKTTVRVAGIFPDTSIRVADGVMLRRFDESDLAHEVVAGDPSYQIDELTQIADSIMEISMSAQYATPVQRRVERLLVILSLFKESCAHYQTYEMRPKSYLHFGGRLRRNVPMAGEPRAVIPDSESSNLANFVKQFEPKIPDAVLWGKILDPLEIALKRYLDSVRENLAIEERLTHAVMGLEALFLEQETELRFRLALRTAQLLKHLDENSREVFDTVYEAYGYRSAHVHGSVLSDNEAIRVQEAMKKIWRYLRKSLLFWLAEAIASDTKKKQLLKDIDSSFIDDTKRENLKARIEKAKQIMKGAL